MANPTLLDRTPTAQTNWEWFESYGQGINSDGLFLLKFEYNIKKEMCKYASPFPDSLMRQANICWWQVAGRPVEIHPIPSLSPERLLLLLSFTKQCEQKDNCQSLFQSVMQRWGLRNCSQRRHQTQQNYSGKDICMTKQDFKSIGLVN